MLFIDISELNETSIINSLPTFPVEVITLNSIYIEWLVGLVSFLSPNSTAMVMSVWSAILSTLFLGKPPGGKLLVLSAHFFHH